MDRTCDRCQTTIPHGHPYITLLHNIEQMSRDVTTRSDYVTVISSEELIVLCGKCGNQFHAKTVKKIIKTIPSAIKRVMEN